MDYLQISTANLPHPLLAMEAKALNSASSRDPEAAVVLLVGSGTPESRLPLEKIEAAFAKSANLAVLLLEAEPGESPPSVAPFVPFVADLPAVAFRRSAALGEFSDVSEPLREWLMRAVEVGQRLDRLITSVNDGSPGFERLPMLRPQEPGRDCHWIRERIERLDLQILLPRIGSPADATAFRAGLLQMNDFLDASHQQSQSVEGAGRNSAGDYWHGIMHRREPDYTNAKYWFRRIGTHPVYMELASRAESLLSEFPQVSAGWRDRLLPGGRWDPFAFVDLCQSCPTAESDDLSHFARRLQWSEMQLLLEQTCQDAKG